MTHTSNPRHCQASKNGSSSGGARSKAAHAKCQKNEERMGDIPSGNVEREGGEGPSCGQIQERIRAFSESGARRRNSSRSRGQVDINDAKAHSANAVQKSFGEKLKAENVAEVTSGSESEGGCFFGENTSSIRRMKSAGTKVRNRLRKTGIVGSDSDDDVMREDEGSLSLNLSWEELTRNVLIVLIHRMGHFWGTLATTLSKPEEILGVVILYLLILVTSYKMHILDDPKRPEKRQKHIWVLLWHWFSSFVLRGIGLGLLWWQFSPEILPKGLTRFMWVMRYHSAINELPGLIHSLAEIFFEYQRHVLEVPILGAIKSVALRLGQATMATFAFLDWRYKWGILCNRDVHTSMALAFVSLGAQPLQILLFSSRDSGTNFRASGATIALGLASSVFFMFTVSVILPMYLIDSSHYRHHGPGRVHSSFETMDRGYEAAVLEAAAGRLPFGRDKVIPDCERMLRMEQADFRLVLNLYTGWELSEEVAKDAKVVMEFLNSCDLSHPLIAQVYHHTETRNGGRSWYGERRDSFMSGFSWATFFSELREFIGHSKDYLLPFSAAVTAAGFRLVNAISPRLRTRVTTALEKKGGIVGGILAESTRNLFDVASEEALATSALESVNEEAAELDAGSFTSALTRSPLAIEAKPRT